MDSNQNNGEKFELMAADQRAMMLQNETNIWLNVAKFEQVQRVATMLSRTDFIPAAFKGNVGNCMIALDLADRMRMHPLMLMQTMYIVHGRPGFEGKFVSALVNNSGRYNGKLKYEWKGENGAPEWGCRAYAFLIGTNERVDGPWVDWRMVVAEGWNKPKGGNKPGSQPQISKWMTMPEIMFMYRAASFFGKTHDSDLLMGMQTIEELEDMDSHTMVAGPGGVYTTGDEQKPEGLYDATKVVQGEENENANNNGSDDSDPGDPGQGAGPEPPNPPEWDPLKEEVMQRYPKDKAALLKSRAESMGIDIKGKLPREVHLIIQAAHGLTDEDADQLAGNKADHKPPDMNMDLLDAYNRAMTQSAKKAKEIADEASGVKRTLNGRVTFSDNNQLRKWLDVYIKWHIDAGLPDPLAEKDEEEESADDGKF